MNRIIYALITLIIFYIGYLGVEHKESFSEEATYVSSNSCVACHSGHHESVKDSMHSKIFKAYTHDAQIVADFKNKPDFVTFDKKDVDVIVGSKWEQVFGQEIDGEHYPLPAKWMVLTQEWVPYRVDSWQETPFTEKCNGCHTTGLDEHTGEFVEWGVSCESCHGPGSKHVHNQKKHFQGDCVMCHGDKPTSLAESIKEEPDIIVSPKSAVCGQCHSRGTQKIDKYHTQRQFNFPVEYLPGQNINPQFKPTTPQTDKKGANWWGNGVSKNRHQEYADFARSGHNRSLADLKTKKPKYCTTQTEPNDSCLKCHSQDYRLSPKDEKPTLDDVKLGLTCVTCHDPHFMNEPRKQTNINDNCADCHMISMQNMALDKGKPHYPCPTTEVKCADCHMPRIVQTGGKYSLRSHAFKIIPPEATEKYGMPNSCQNGSCHQDKSTQWAKEAFADYYGKTPETLSEKVRAK